MHNVYFVQYDVTVTVTVWGGRIDKGKLYSCLTADLTFAQIDLQENYSLPYFTPHLAWGLRDHPC